MNLHSIKSALLVFVAMSSFQFVNAQQKAIPLYEKEIPNSKKAVNYVERTDSSGLVWKVTHPNITPYFPEKGTANGSAVIICPGGGYLLLAEAKSILFAKAFNKIGVTAFILKYRLPNDTIMVDKMIGPLQDAQRAIQLVRKRSAEWDINPNKIGVFGFSSGGHVAAMTGTQFANPVIENKEMINLRPDFMVLLYPITTFDPLMTIETRERLIGKTPSAKAIDFYCREKHVTANTPQALLVHAADDDVVSVKNSLTFFDALLKYDVKASMHIVQTGGHGFTLDNPPSKDKWFDWCSHWLEQNGFLTVASK